jgi:hypothetical protein
MGKRMTTGKERCLRNRYPTASTAAAKPLHLVNRVFNFGGTMYTITPWPAICGLIVLTIGGCNEVTIRNGHENLIPTRNPTQEEDWTTAGRVPAEGGLPARDLSHGIILEVESVLDSEAGALKAGGTGFVVLRMTNTLNRTVRLPLAGYFGLGARPQLVPSVWNVRSDVFRGYRVARSAIGFQKDGKSVTQDRFALPEEIVLGPGEAFWLWCPIRTPQKRGSYSLCVELDSENLKPAYYSNSELGGRDFVYIQEKVVVPNVQVE